MITYAPNWNDWWWPTGTVTLGTWILQILFVSEQSAENKVIMHFWDGTDASPACLNPS